MEIVLAHYVTTRVIDVNEQCICNKDMSDFYE